MTMVADLSHIHRFSPATGAGKPPLLLLHGTGGDENDLIGLGSSLLPGAALISPRGQVTEQGMPRFFRRLSEGVFDEADVVRRAGALAAFVQEARAAYALEAPVAVGFSNGANIAAALLYLHPKVLSGAILFRAMVPLQAAPEGAIPQTPVLILSGASDPIVPTDNAARLAASLQQGGARVTHDMLPAGHNLTQMDLAIARGWLTENFAQPGE